MSILKQKIDKFLLLRFSKKNYSLEYNIIYKQKNLGKIIMGCKKRFLFIVILFSLLVANLVLSSVYAYDVAYILKNDRQVKNEILDVFSELGLSVEIIEDSSILTKNLANYKIVFVDDAILRKTRNLAIYNYNSVIMNKNYGQEWGLTDVDGISQLAATAPLQVRVVDNSIEQVYTQARYNGVNIPYYYLANENKASGFRKIAGTYTGNTIDLGDVVSVAGKGTRLMNNKISQGKICFYGIAKTKYWTENARQLFIDCVSSLLVECYNDGDCDDTNAYTYDYCVNPGTISSRCEHEPIACLNNNDCGVNSFVGSSFCNNDLLRNFRAFSCNNPGTTSSYCSYNDTPMITQDCGDDSCDAFGGNYCKNNDVYHSRTCYDRGCSNNACFSNSSIEEIKVEECSQGCEEGECIEIECFQNSDCGTDFLSGNLCSGNNAVRNFLNFTCNNPGTFSSYCTNISGNYLIQECDLCFNGNCLQINCTRNEDCDDGNIRTFDECVNPNTTASFCRNTEVNCLSNDDCGITGFIEDNFCFDEDVYKYYQNSTCLNPGTLESSCNIVVSPRLTQDCDDEDDRTIDSCEENPVRCEHNFIECFDDLDCSNGGFINNFCNNSELWNNVSIPVCLNPGTIFSDCSFSLIQTFNRTCEFGCSQGECLGGIHDVAIVQNLSEYVNGIKIEQNSSVVLGEPAELLCDQSFVVKYRVKNLGDFNENINATGKINSFKWQQSLFDLDIGETSTDRTKTVSSYFIPGFYNIFINASIIGFVDNNPADNFASREIEIICPEECIDNDGDGYNATNEECGEEDCDDSNPEVNPGAEEVCNQIDDDCDELVDEGDVCIVPELNCQIVSRTGDWGSAVGGLQVDCPSDYVITGGGFEDKTNNEDDQDISKPQDNGWLCGEKSKHENGKCYAICCDSSLIENKVEEVFGDQNFGVIVNAPLGYILTGGGFEDNSNEDDDQDENKPLDNNWYCKEDRSSISSGCYGVFARAIDFDLECIPLEITGNQNSGIQVNCPSGYAVVGGGFLDAANNDDDQDVSIPQANGWYCQEDNSNSNSVCYARCCRIF